MSVSKATKKQHFVPQFYLRGFANANDRLNVYDKQTKKSFIDTVGQVGQQRFFYDIPELSKATQKQLLEQWFQMFEGAAAESIRKIISVEGEYTIANPDRKILALFIAVQFMRTPEFRKHVGEIAEGIAYAFSQLHLDAKGIKAVAREDFTINANSALLQAQSLLSPDSVDEMAKELYANVWLILKNETNDLLVTSDHPVVIGNFTPDSSIGLISYGAKVFFPLSTNHLLLIMDRDYISQYTNFEATDGALLSSNLATWFHEANQHQYDQCQRFIYTADGKIVKGIALSEKLRGTYNPSKQLEVSSFPVSRQQIIIRARRR